MHTLIEMMIYCQNAAVEQQTIFKSYLLTVLVYSAQDLCANVGAV